MKIKRWLCRVSMVVGLIVLAIRPLYADSSEKIPVTVTIAPLEFFVEQIGKEYVDVSVMVPSYANPHVYEPLPSQLVALSRARMYVQLGSGIEFETTWMSKFIALNSRMTLCDVSKGITLIECADEHDRDAHGHAGKDPHIWLSVINALQIVDTITQSLGIVDPVHAGTYRANAEKLKTQLNTLHQDLMQILAPCKGSAFIVFHPGWGYFARDYGLREIPIELGGKEPTAAGLASVIKTARAEHSRVIFISPQFSKKSAEVIAREIQGKVVCLDPLAKSYLQNLQEAARLIREEKE